jgi:peptidoglycan/LPS O-acetylase OafA/YrhL
MGDGRAVITPSITPTQAGYLRGLDGLRGLAVLAVIAFHCGLSGAPGGFLGVEVFFVISGFIITSSLIPRPGDARNDGLRDFWGRRLRRLLPATLVLVFSLLTYSLVFEPSNVAQLREESVASLAYVMNWYLVFDGQSYFESFSRPSLLRHLWSLAVEAQFYVVWPVLLWFGLRFFGRKTVVALVVTGALASATLMAVLFQTGTDASRLYYGTDTRASGFLIGAAFALAVSLVPSTSLSSARIARVLDVAALVCLTALAVMVWRVDTQSAFLYQGGFFVVSMATVGVIAATLSTRSAAQRALGVAPLHWMGVRSYGIYLWHWPAVLLITSDLGLPLGEFGLALVQTAVAIAIAAVSYAFIETPVRSGWLQQAWRASLSRGRLAKVRVFAVTSGVSVAALFVAGAACNADRPETPDYMKYDSVRIDMREPTATATAVPIAALADVARPLPDRADCSAIRGTAYRSIAERDWFRAHCIVVPSPTTSPVARVQAAPTVVLASAAQRPPASPTPTPIVPAQRVAGTVTAIGDSVMLGAANHLAGSFESIYVDAAASRQVADGVKLLRELEATGQLSDVIVIHLGNNGVFKDAHVDEIMAIAGNARRVIFVTVNIDRPWESASNAAITASAARHANASVADWKLLSDGQAGLFWKDGTHVRPEGAALYADLLRSSVASVRG